MRKIRLHSRFCAYHFNFGVSRLLSIQLNFIDRDTACWWKQYFSQNVYLMFFKHVYFTWLNRFYCPTLFLSVRNFFSDLDRTFFAYFSLWNVYEFSEQKIAYLHNFLHFPFAWLKELNSKILSKIWKAMYPRQKHVRMIIILFNKDPKYSF